MSKSTITALRFIKIREVVAMTGLSKSSIYDYMNAGLFPKAVTLGARSVGWVQSEIEQWMEEQMAKRNVEAAQ